MAKLKLQKYPKKPKTTASAATIKNYFDRCKEVDRENAKRKSEHNEQKRLADKLRRFKPGHHSAPGATKRRKPATSGKKKAARRRRK